MRSAAAAAAVAHVAHVAAGASVLVSRINALLLIDHYWAGNELPEIENEYQF